MNKKSVPIQKPIDWSDTLRIVEDLWLFLAGSPKLQSATIDRQLFMHEVKLMIDIAITATEQRLKPPTFKELKNNLKEKAAATGIEVIDESELLSPPGDTILETMKLMGIDRVILSQSLILTARETDNLLIGRLPITDQLAEKL